MKIILLVLLAIVLVLFIIAWWQGRYKSKIYKFFIPILAENVERDSYYKNMGWNKDGSLKTSKQIEVEGEYKIQISSFIDSMKVVSDWYEVIQARGKGHAMMAESMNIKVDDYEFWANAHKEEYMLKYNDGNLDVEGIKLRIEKFGFIVSELEKVIKKAAELKFNITHEMHNDYCAARASILGAEYSLIEMTK